MKKNVIAILLSLVVAVSSIGPVPVIAAETAAAETTAVETTAKKRKNTSKPTETVTALPEVTATPGPMDKAQELADYLFEHGELPENFITKQEARDLGWDSSYNYVSDVAPGMSIGGDYFGNYEGQLPKAKGRKFHECDCNYTGGKRGAERIIYSNDGHVWYTNDHYGTFTELFPSNSP